MKSYAGYKFCIRISGREFPYHDCLAWLMQNIDNEDWSATTGITAFTTDYRFCNPEDAMLFKLRFGGHDIRRD
jgi:hypothetical protein